MISKMIRTTCSLALGASLATACAHQTPQELIDARAAYQRAEQSPAKDLAPAQLDTAHKSLVRAEAAFKDEPGDQKTRDYAYVALRRSELAEAQAGLVLAERQADETRKQQLTDAERARRDTEQKLGQTQQQLNETERLRAVEQAKSAAEQAKTAEQLSSTQAQLDEAKKRNDDLASSLAKIGAVKQDERGTVVTMQGSVLFGSGKSELQGGARGKLDQLKSALTSSNNKQTIVIEGHTDSVGSASLNQSLSQSRAEAVRNYLISQGLDAGRVRAVGMGKDHPIDDNATAEGRANNRRVEIILERPTS